MYKKLKNLPILFFLVLCFYQANSQEVSEARKTILQAAEVLYSNTDSARKLNQLALSLSLTSQDSITAYKIFGVLEDIEGNPNDAFPFFNKAYSLAIRDGNGVEIGNILMNYGNMHQSLRNYDAALEYYLAAMEEMEKNDDPRDLKNKSAVRNNLGTLYKKMGLFEMSIAFYEKSISYAEQHDDARSLGMALSNLGGVNVKFDKLDYGYPYLLKADSIYSSLNEVWGRSSLNMNLALYYRKKGETKKARHYIDQKIEIDKAYNDTSRFIEGSFLLAEIHDYNQEYDEALAILSELEDLAKGQDMYSELVDIFKLQAIIANKKNEPLIENEKLKLALAYKDSVEAQSTKEKLISLKAKEDISNAIFKLKEAEKQSQELKFQLRNDRNFIFLLSAIVLILLLIVLFVLIDARTKKRFTNELNLKNQQLNKINTNQQKLVSVLAHDFKSPLAATLGLIELLEQNTLSEQEKVEFLEAIKQKIDNTIHNVENVVNWMITQNGDFGVKRVEVELNQFIDNLIGFVSLQAAYKQIDIKVNTSDFDRVIADKHHLQIILRNLLSNAIKYSQKESIVEINARIENNKKVIEVKDSGVGIHAKDLSLLKNFSLESKVGTDGEQGTGLGFRLISDFCNLNNIQIQIESTPNEGSSFTLVFDE